MNLESEWFINMAHTQCTVLMNHLFWFRVVLIDSFVAALTVEQLPVTGHPSYYKKTPGSLSHYGVTDYFPLQHNTKCVTADTAHTQQCSRPVSLTPPMFTPHCIVHSFTTGSADHYVCSWIPTVHCSKALSMSYAQEGTDLTTVLSFPFLSLIFFFPFFFHIM